MRARSMTILAPIYFLSFSIRGASWADVKVFLKWKLSLNTLQWLPRMKSTARCMDHSFCLLGDDINSRSTGCDFQISPIFGMREYFLEPIQFL